MLTQQDIKALTILSRKTMIYSDGQWYPGENN